MAHRPAPPPPARPGQVTVYKAVYPYTAQRGDELSFVEGDLLYITDKSDSTGWWKGSVGNQTGLIPSNYVTENAETVENPLHEAAKRGNITFLEDLLRNKVSVNALDKSGSTALHWAAHGGHMDCVVALLNVTNISITVQNKLGDTALHNAAWKGHAEIVEELLRKGADKNVKNNAGDRPFNLASRHPAAQKHLKEGKSFDDGDYGQDDEEDDE